MNRTANLRTRKRMDYIGNAQENDNSDDGDFESNHDNEVNQQSTM